MADELTTLASTVSLLKQYVPVVSTGTDADSLAAIGHNYAAAYEVLPLDPTVEGIITYTVDQDIIDGTVQIIKENHVTGSIRIISL